MSGYKSLVGQRFGRLEVLRRAENATGSHKTQFFCRCDCGKELLVKSTHLTQGWTQSCGCLRTEKTRERMTGPNNPGWTGQRWMQHGYALVWDPKRQKQIQEHRLVMEEHLGRELFPDEKVHHLSGDKLDNRIENLELWTISHPAGQRVTDAIAHAKELLRRYGETI